MTHTDRRRSAIGLDGTVGGEVGRRLVVRLRLRAVVVLGMHANEEVSWRCALVREFKSKPMVKRGLAVRGGRAAVRKRVAG